MVVRLVMHPWHRSTKGADLAGKMMEESRKRGMECSLDHSAGRGDLTGMLVTCFQVGAPW